MVAFEGTQFVDDHHVEIPREIEASVVVHKPFHIVTVDGVEQSLGVQGSLPFLRRARDNRKVEVAEVLPLIQLRRPRVTRYSKGCDDEHLGDSE